MSKSKRIEKRINRIEDRFKKKVAKGKKGTDMDIELHERRIKDLKDKSPLNFGLFGGARAALRSGRGRKKLAGRINKLENQVGVLMKARHESMDPVEMGTQEPMYATSVQGDVADNVIQANDLANDQLASQGIQPLNAFSPETQNTAGAMFGSSIPGSFDRDMGMSRLNSKKSSKTEDQKEKPLTDKEKKRLHAVSSINYDKVVASGGVDLGIIKNKKKK